MSTEWTSRFDKLLKMKKHWWKFGSPRIKLKHLHRTHHFSELFLGSHFSKIGHKKIGAHHHATLVRSQDIETLKYFFFRLHRENGDDYYCKLPAACRVEHTNSWLKRNRSFCPFIVDVPTSGDGTTAICFDGIRHRSGKADSIQHCFLEISVGQENSFSNFYN
jgi:hypothetical protein